MMCSKVFSTEILHQGVNVAKTLISPKYIHVSFFSSHCSDIAMEMDCHSLSHDHCIYHMITWCFRSLWLSFLEYLITINACHNHNVWHSMKLSIALLVQNIFISIFVNFGMDSLTFGKITCSHDSYEMWNIIIKVHVLVQDQRSILWNLILCEVRLF